jgi:preprotein translocase subunit SecA
VDGLLRRVEEIFTPSAAIASIDPNRIDREDLTLRLQEEALAQYDRREQELGSELMRALERFLLLQIIDQRWREHLYDMDYLREGIHLRGFAQIEPLVAYKNEAFELFRDLMNSVWGDFARMIFHVEVTVEGQGPDGGPGGPSPAIASSRPSADSSSSTGGGRVSYSGGGAPQGALAMAAAAAGAVEGYAADGEGYAGDDGGFQPVEQRRVDPDEQLGRNDPCWCGSGKKFKKCHGA